MESREGKVFDCEEYDGVIGLFNPIVSHIQSSRVHKVHFSSSSKFPGIVVEEAESVLDLESSNLTSQLLGFAGLIGFKSTALLECCCFELERGRPTLRLGAGTFFGFRPGLGRGGRTHCRLTCSEELRRSGETTVLGGGGDSDDTGRSALLIKLVAGAIG